MHAINDIQFARLLLKHKTIVLQGIGTFSLSETPATSQRMGRDFQPPTSKISFLQHESQTDRLQDILLSDAGSGITLESDAAEISNNYIVGIKFQLEKSGLYHFPGLGTLKINEAGRLHFDTEADPFNFGLPEFNANVVSKQVSTPVPAKPKRKKRVRVWFIVLLLIIGGSVASWFLIPEVPENVLPLWEKAVSIFDKGKADKDTTTTKPADTTQNVVPVDTMTQDTITQDTLINEGPLTYFVIAGSFVDKSEADNYCNTLKQKGYPEAVVLVSEADRRIRVAYKGFATREEALSFLNQTKITENKSDIWLLHQN